MTKPGINVTLLKTTRTLGKNPSVRIGTYEESPAVATHPTWNQECNQSYPVGSRLGYMFNEFDTT